MKRSFSLEPAQNLSPLLFHLQHKYPNSNLDGATISDEVHLPALHCHTQAVLSWEQDNISLVK